MKDVSRISDSEWEIMKVIWAMDVATSEDIITALSIKTNWTPQTVKTFLNRLLKKGIIDYEKKGRNYLYYAKFSEKECRQVENKNFLERVYGGAVNLLFSNFLEDESLTDEDIERLQKILDEKKNKKE